MPFGSFSAAYRLGIANSTQRNPTAFAQTVLRLPGGAPVYQQQLVHDLTDRMGPPASAEWCGNPDNEVGRSNILRSVSGHDMVFAKRNISDSPHYRYNSYIYQHYNQAFFLTNEPEASSKVTVSGASGRCVCWNPETSTIDAAVAGCFPTPSSTFWEYNIGGIVVGDGCSVTGNWQRSRAAAMARVYRYVKALGEAAGRGHAVIPPPSIGPILGATGDAYWTGFYDAAMWGIGASGSCGAYGGLSASQLNALHTHSYTYYSNTPSTNPIDVTARMAIDIRRGADWFRNRYVGAGKQLPFDYVLSETGPDWRILSQFGDTSVSWTGGFNTMVQGLSFWNSYLAWLTRRASVELNLQGWESGSRALFAAVHAPANAPYVTVSGTNGSRNQWYMNLDAWDTYVYYNAPMIETSRPGATGQYQSSFSAFQTTPYNNNNWRLGPFGACYAVWSAVGNDPNVSTLGAGWIYDNGQAGSRGRVSVSVPAGWSTIYIPFMKNIGATAGVQYQVTWHRSDGAQRGHGWIDFGSFEDARTVNADGYAQNVYSAMTLPLIVYSSSARTFQLELSRNYAGTGIFVGRPIVLGGVACSWSIYH